MWKVWSYVCKKQYLHLVIELPWVSVTKTIHISVAHSPEMIWNNDSKGLKEYSEEGLESSKKI